MSLPIKKIAVVGGGITGIAVAYELAKQGKQVTLFEKASRVGGLVGTFEIGNVRLEKFFHHIFHSDTAILRVIEELNLNHLMYWAPTRMGVYSEGQFFPFNGPRDLLLYSPLSFTDRIRFGIQTLMASRDNEGIHLDDRTVRDWVEESWSPNIYKRFWQPLLRGKFGPAAEEISAAWLWGRINARGQSRKSGKEELGYMRGGFHMVLEAMAEFVSNNGGEIKTHALVDRISQNEAKWVIHVNQKAFDDFDAVVLAVPSPQLYRLFPDMPAEEIQAHDRIRYASIMCLPMTMDRPLSDFYWLNVADEKIPFTGVIEQTNFVPKKDYGDQHVVYLFNYLPSEHPWLKESKQEVFDRYFDEGVAKLFPKAKREHFKKVMIFRDSFATPVYEVDYLKKMPPIQSATPGMFYANTSHIFPDDRNMSHSIDLARRVVDQMVI